MYSCMKPNEFMWIHAWSHKELCLNSLIIKCYLMFRQLPWEWNSDSDWETLQRKWTMSETFSFSNSFAGGEATSRTPSSQVFQRVLIRAESTLVMSARCLVMRRRKHWQIECGRWRGRTPERARSHGRAHHSPKKRNENHQLAITCADG